jgi:predicted PolB exonuclease-like 3'-5' exonuclease
MLRSNIHDRVWFFDLEWVPDSDAAKILLDLRDDIPEADAFEALWQYCGATPERPRPFLKYLYSRIVSVAVLMRNVRYDGPESRLEFNLRSLPKLPAEKDECNEAEIICEFLEKLGKYRPQIVGFNSNESDMQVLIQRGIINHVSAPMFCERPLEKWDKNDYFARWDNEFHLDMLKLFTTSNKSMMPRLNDMARLCGFPGKLDVDGQQVADLWLSGRLNKIVEYNQIDALNTYLIWLRVVYFCGKINESQYENELAAFREFLVLEAAKDNRAHIQDFLDKWPESRTAMESVATFA